MRRKSEKRKVSQASGDDEKTKRVSHGKPQESEEGENEKWKRRTENKNSGKGNRRVGEGKKWRKRGKSRKYAESAIIKTSSIDRKRKVCRVISLLMWRPRTVSATA